MPELPEVEVTRRQIEPLLVGRTIARVVTTAQSYFFVTPPAELARRLRDRRIEGIARRGKYLLVRLDDQAQLLLHLGMTGQLFAAGAASPRLLQATARSVLTPEEQRAAFSPDAHTHLQIGFADDGPRLYFRDTRKFGKVQLLLPGESNRRLEKLGIDALLASGADLHSSCRGRRVAIKSLLIDQSVLAGIGNIYADEALFVAGIRPTRPAHKVSRPACDAIVSAAQRVMLRSIETGGSSISDYVRPDGSDGGYQDERRVYAREGEPCGICRSVIRKIVLGQRSSCYCPRCQH